VVIEHLILVAFNRPRFDSLLDKIKNELELNKSLYKKQVGASPANLMHHGCIINKVNSVHRKETMQIAQIGCRC
jgi:hypothetical protein